MPQEQSRLDAGTILRKRYAIQCVLGADDTGTVYLVKDLQLKRQKYSLFVLKEIIGLNRQARYQYIFDGVALRHLQHPALPRIHHVFNDDKRERVYLVSDYVEGTNLETLRQQQPQKRFTWSELEPLIEPLIEALSYLHGQEKPLIHSNIKPTSVIKDIRGKIMLVDLGCIRATPLESPQTSLDSLSCYRAPEYFAGTIDSRSDIYSLGATILALLTGQTLIDALVRRKQVQEGLFDPQPIASEIAPDVSHSLAQILQQALTLDSEQRFASAQAFWDALQTLPVRQSAITSVSPDSVEDEAATSPMSDGCLALPSPADQGNTSPLTPDPVSSVDKHSARPLVRHIVVSSPSSPLVPHLHGLITHPIMPPPMQIQQPQNPWRRVLFLRAAIICVLLFLLLGAGAWMLSTIHGHTPAPIAIKQGHTSVSPVPMDSSPSPQATVPDSAVISPPTLNGFPDMLGTYYGNLQSVSPPSAAGTTIAFTLIIQHQMRNTMNGTFNAPDYKNGKNANFTGTVDTIGNVKFNIIDAAGNAILIFNGGLSSNVSYAFHLGGNFYSCPARPARPAGPAGPARPAKACLPKTHPSGSWIMQQD